MAEVQDAAGSWPHGPTRFELRYGNAITRVVVALIGIPIILGSVWLGGWAFLLLIAAASTGALLEFYWITEKRGASPNKALGVLAGLLLCLAFMYQGWDPVGPQLLAARHGADLAASSAVALARQLVALVGIVLLLAISVLTVQMFRRASENPIADISSSLAGVAYVPFCMATLIGIRQMPESMFIVRDAAAQGGAGLENYGFYLVLAVLVSIWICDSAAYYAGRALGRHKLFERVSPKKTWEGSIAGALAAVGTMIGMRALWLDTLSLGDTVVLGLIVGVCGQIGDLAESHLKRAAGVKDSSHLIPGHGGVFDRFDSLLFVSPLVYLYLVAMLVLR
jgi:phosphatidate cytidylyltransferase